MYTNNNKLLRDQSKNSKIRNVIYSSLFLLFATFTMFTIFSCCKKDEVKEHQKESSLSSLENQSLEPEAFFEKISSMNLKTNKGNAIHIYYEWNAKDKTIKYLGSVEKELVLFPSAFKNKEDFLKRVANKTYTVTCDNGDGRSWTKTCGNPYSCAGLVGDCLNDEGGCATVCEQIMVYIPHDRSFYLGRTFHK